jgi:hypothetical protein
MKPKMAAFISVIITAILIFNSAYVSPKHIPAGSTENAVSKKYLYVAVPGIRDYLGYGGHGG